MSSSRLKNGPKRSEATNWNKVRRAFGLVANPVVSSNSNTRSSSMSSVGFPELTASTREARLTLNRLATLLENGFVKHTPPVRKEDSEASEIESNPSLDSKLDVICEEEDSATSTEPRYGRRAVTTLTAGPELLPKISDAADKRYSLSSAILPVPQLEEKVVVETDHLIGGTLVTPELAVELRKLVYGSTIHSYSSEFRKSCFAFQARDGPFPYGLVTSRSGARGVVLCVQAFILKYLIYKYGTREEILGHRVLQPSDYERQVARVDALSHILWQAGEERHACVTLTQSDDCFDPLPRYRFDGITERFDRESKASVVLYIYSLVLTRTIPKIQSDFGRGLVQLLSDHEELQRPLVNLLLTGTAVQNLFNGDICYNDNGKLLLHPERGIRQRATVGFLYWSRDETDRTRTQVGSMLMTPWVPIWLTCVSGHFGLVFSTNPDLVADWRTEHRFCLYYYTGLPAQSAEARLSVDTRFGRTLVAKTQRGRREEEKRIPTLEKCLMTKWPGSNIDWNGTTPFVLPA